MRVLMLDPSPSFLEERRRLGHDRRDEVWDGVIHMPPDPSPQHQSMGTQHFAVAPDRDGVVRAPALGVELQTFAGRKLRITWGDGAAEI